MSSEWRALPYAAAPCRISRGLFWIVGSAARPPDPRQKSKSVGVTGADIARRTE